MEELYELAQDDYRDKHPRDILASLGYVLVSHLDSTHPIILIITIATNNKINSI